MTKNSSGGIVIIILALVILLGVFPVYSSYILRESFSRYELSLIGRIHEARPSWEAEYLELAYTTKASADEAAAGSLALAAFGYTSQGADILKKSILPVSTAMPVIILPILLSVAVLSLLAFFTRIVLNDKTAAKQKERRLSQEIGQLLFLRDRNGQLQRFIEAMAHQIKTPVSRCITSLELLRDDMHDASIRIDECISHILEIHSLSSRLLTIARLEAGAILFSSEEFSLSDLLRDVSLSIPADKRPEEIEETGLWYGSYQWTREALSNLIKNCLEHDESDLPLSLSCVEEPDGFRIVLRDHGPGFEESDLPYLFDRFFTPQKEKKGHVGLGLNLSRLIIENQKGTLQAENAPDGGAVFRIFLPKYQSMR